MRRYFRCKHCLCQSICVLLCVTVLFYINKLNKHFTPLLGHRALDIGYITQDIQCLFDSSESKVSSDDTHRLAEIFKQVDHASSDPRLPRALTPTMYKDTVAFLSKVRQVFTEHNITWTLSFGSLLGSVLCHDVLPWDDDLDCSLLKSDLNKFEDLHRKGILKDSYGLGYIIKNRKIFDLSKPFIKPYTWSYPFIDITHFEINNTVVKLTDWRRPKRNYQVDSEHYFPLRLRPFAGMWLPVPRYPWSVLNVIYQALSCKMSGWNHTQERHHKNPPHTNCSSIRPIYPNVYFTKKGNISIETLYFRNTSLYDMCIDDNHNQYQATNAFWEA